MRVLISGSRGWTDKQRIIDALDKLPKIDIIIQGGAKGADSIARDIAKERNIQCITYPALWNKYGRAAGMIRNQQMLDEGKPDIVLAFPKKTSIGTFGMMRIAKKAGITVEMYKDY